jgi:hypothetical protein
MKNPMKLIVMWLVAVAANLNAATTTTPSIGGGVQPDLALHYPEGYTPKDESGGASTLTFPAGFTGQDLTALLHSEHPG